MKMVADNQLSVFTYDDFLVNNGAIFQNGERANVIHAYTQRTIVYEFICAYMNMHPTPNPSVISL